HVLDDVRDEQRIEAAGAVVLGGSELAGRECLEPALARRAHAVLVDVDADAANVEQVAADAAAEVERQPRIETAQMPRVQPLEPEPPFPARSLQTNQTVGVILSV